MRRYLAALIFALVLVLPASATVSSVTQTGFTVSNKNCGTHFDIAGNDGSSESVDTVPCNDVHGPIVDVTSPPNGAQVGPAPFTFSASASDPAQPQPPVERVSGVADVQFQIDSVNYGAPDTVAPYSTQVDPSAYPAGEHLLRAIATDVAGNSTTSAEFSINFVAAPPPPPPPPPPPAGSANVWVDTNGGACVRSATKIAYNDANACASASAAAAVAVSGDTVLLAAGLYPQQSVGKAFTSTTIIGCVPGAVIDVPPATDGAMAKAFLFLSGANNVTLANCELTDGVSVEASSTTDNITIDGNYIHSTSTPSANGTWAGYTSYGVVNRMTKPGSTLKIINNRIKDVAVQCTANGATNGCDKDDNSFGGGLSRGYCIYDFASQNLIVDGNILDGCWDDGIQVHAVNFTFTDNEVMNTQNPFVVNGNHQDGIQIFTANPVNASIERNFFHKKLATAIRIQDVAHTGYVIRNNVVAGNQMNSTGFDLEDLSNSIISFNTVTQPNGFGSNITGPDVAISGDKIENNYFGPAGNGTGLVVNGTGHTIRNNDLPQYSGPLCSPGCLTGIPLFVNEAGEDLRPTAGSILVNAGVVEAGATVDIGGRPRPAVAGTLPDIGAWERQSTDP